MLGPHFYYDLIRLARKPRNYYLRCGYLIALMIGWWYVYEGSQPLGGTINDYARLATNFTYALLAFQYAMILLLVPIYLAGTIVEERESRTLELLFQTQLTDREILLGKFAARVVHLMFFVLMSLPMLSIISLWGGISVEFLLVHFAFSLLLILLVGSMCLWVSTTAATYTEAMMLAYVMQLPMLYGAFVMGAVAADIAGGGGGVPWESSPWLLLICAIPMLGAAAIFFYVIALWRFRELRNMTWIKKSDPPPRRLPRPKPKRPRSKRRESTGRTIPDNSLLWKETEHNQYVIDLPISLIRLGQGAFVFMSCWYAIIQFSEQQVWQDIGVLLLTFALLGYTVLLGLTYLGIAFQATSAVAHERERNTLDFLLLLPVERSRILLAKWASPWIRQRMLLLTMLAVPLIGMMTTMFPARAALLMLLLPWPSLLLVNTLGLFLSVVCRRTVTANILLISLLVVGLALHLLAWDALILLTHGYIDVLVDDRFPGPETRLHARLLVLGHQTAILLLAGLFAYLAFWRFERQAG